MHLCHSGEGERKEEEKRKRRQRRREKEKIFWRHRKSIFSANPKPNTVPKDANKKKMWKRERERMKRVRREREESEREKEKIPLHQNSRIEKMLYHMFISSSIHTMHFLHRMLIYTRKHSFRIENVFWS